MRIDKKLTEWEAAGLIEPEQRARIARYEAERTRPILPMALAALGAITIGVGLVSLVAANWDGIGRAAKLAVDLTLLGAVGSALYAVSRRERPLATDTLAAVYALLTLASIGLLGQTYQLGSPTWQALVGWTVLTLPTLWLVRGRLLGGVWLAQLYLAEGSALYALVEYVDGTPSLGPALSRELAAALVAPAWLAPLLLAHVPRLRRPRPLVAQAFVEGAWGLFLCAGLALACVFYGATDLERVHWGALPFVAALALLGGLLPTLYPELSARGRGGLLAGLGLVACAGVFGVAFERAAMPALVPLVHVAMLGCAAFVCVEAGSLRAFHALTGLVALRVLIAYFEVFGSMLDTGLGMIAGGGVTLLVVWLWRRKAPALARRLGAEGTGREP